MKFVLPPQSDVANARPKFEDPNDKKWDNVFSCDGRAARGMGKENSVGNDGNYIFAYQEDDRKAEMTGNFIKRSETDCDKKECDPMDAVDKKESLIFCFLRQY